MEELWQVADRRSAEFDAEALAYDRFRPRYPEGLFDDIVELGCLTPDMTAIDVGAGTGIATEPWAVRGIGVIAVEPSLGMAAVGQRRLGDRATWIVRRFEDVVLEAPVDAIAAFNSWHWVEPNVGVERAAALLRPGGSIALVWTPVVAWGSQEFEQRLAHAFGAPWPKTLDAVLESRHVVERDHRFEPYEVRRRRFERTMDAATFVAVTRTYGGPHSAERDAILTRLIDDIGGSVTKVEEAVLYIARRR